MPYFLFVDLLIKYKKKNARLSFCSYLRLLSVDLSKQENKRTMD